VWTSRGSRRIPVGDPALQRLPRRELSDNRSKRLQRGSHLIVVQNRGESHIEVLFAIPADSLTPGLVVIPTISPQNHSKSNSALIGK
jgi:hypothetical protein